VITSIFSHDGWDGLARGVIGTESNHPLTFATNYAHRMIIDIAGNVGIGTPNPTKGKLHVEGGDIFCSGRVFAQNGLVFYWGPDNAWKTLDNRASINGTVAGTGNVGAPSDVRFKAGLRPLRDAVAKVMQLQGKYYRWGEAGLAYFTRNIADLISAGPDATEEDNQRLWAAEREKAFAALSGEHLGLIAQEVEAIVPELVHEDQEGYKYIRYQELTAVLIEAIKEQQALIQALSGRVAALES
jgi:hypothetical protein